MKTFENICEEIDKYLPVLNTGSILEHVKYYDEVNAQTLEMLLGVHFLCYRYVVYEIYKKSSQKREHEYFYALLKTILIYEKRKNIGWWLFYYIFLIKLYLLLNYDNYAGFSYQKVLIKLLKDKDYYLFFGDFTKYFDSKWYIKNNRKNFLNKIQECY